MSLITRISQIAGFLYSLAFLTQVFPNALFPHVRFNCII